MPKSGILNHTLYLLYSDVLHFYGVCVRWTFLGICASEIKRKLIQRRKKLEGNLARTCLLINNEYKIRRRQENPKTGSYKRTRTLFGTFSYHDLKQHVAVSWQCSPFLRTFLLLIISSRTVLRRFRVGVTFFPPL